MRAVRTTLIATALTAAVAGISACGTSSTPAAAPPTPAAAPSTSSGSGSGYGSAPTSAATSAAAVPAATGTLSAMDQVSNGKSVMVASVDLQAGGKGGWVALHADLNGKPGPVKYEVAVPAGASTNVTIPTPGGSPRAGIGRCCTSMTTPSAPTSSRRPPGRTYPRWPTA